MSKRILAALVLTGMVGRSAWPDTVRTSVGGGYGGGGTTLPAVDTTAVIKGSDDGTKQVKLEADGLTTGQTRTVTVPDSNTSLPIASQVLTFSGPTAARTITLPDAATTVPLATQALTFSGPTQARTITLPDGNTTVPSASQLITISGPTAARTYTFPDANRTIAVNNAAQSFTGAQTFSSGVVFDAGTEVTLGTSAYGTFFASGTQTPDGPVLFSGTLSNSWTVKEYGDAGFDHRNGSCGSAACDHPQVNIASANQNLTEYRSHAFWGSAGRNVTTLTEGAATSTEQISVAAEAGTGGVYFYTIYATDGSTPQVRQGRVIFSVTNDGGTETCVLGTPEETDNTPTGTLTVTVTCSTSPTNAVDLQLNADSSLTQTTLESYTRVELVGPGQVTPQ